MARPKAACGTYPAYKRHLREKTPVDAACRRAQQAHDAGRSGVDRPTAPQVAVAPTSAVESRRDAVQGRFLALGLQLVTAARERDVYALIDLFCELDNVLGQWVDLEDDLDYEAGYPDLPTEIRESLLAWRQRIAADEAVQRV